MRTSNLFFDNSFLYEEISHRGMVPISSKKFKLPLFRRLVCVFECLNNRVDSPLDQTNKVSKTQKNFHEKPAEPVALDYHILFEEPKVLKSGYHECFGVSSVDWFVDEMIKQETKSNSSMTQIFF